MEQEKQWHIIYTRPGEEHKVCESLRRKKMVSFYPSNKVMKVSYGREKTVFAPIIERYVFVQLMPEQITDMKSITGSISLVYWLSKPVVVSDEDIHQLRRFCDRHDDIQLQKTKVISLEPAFITTQYTEHDTERIHLHIPVLGFDMTAEERKTRVKVITINNHSKTETSSQQYAEAR